MTSFEHILSICLIRFIFVSRYGGNLLLINTDSIAWFPDFRSVGLQTTQIWGIHLGQVFATRKAVAPFSDIQLS